MRKLEEARNRLRKVIVKRVEIDKDLVIKENDKRVIKVYLE